MTRITALVLTFLLASVLSLGCGRSNKDKGVNSGKDMPKQVKGG
jgi:hypothetical protein